MGLDTSYHNLGCPLIFVMLTVAPRLLAYGFNQCMPHWKKKLRTQNILGHNKPEKVQFIK